jgi:DNA-directed RNA polymerase subunit RPC12/RpoP
VENKNVFMFISKHYTRKEFIDFLIETDYCNKTVDTNNPTNGMTCPGDIKLKDFSDTPEHICTCDVPTCKACWLKAIEPVKFLHEANTELLAEANRACGLYKFDCCEKAIWISKEDKEQGLNSYCPNCGSKIFHEEVTTI